MKSGRKTTKCLVSLVRTYMVCIYFKSLYGYFASGLFAHKKQLIMCFTLGFHE